ncbi:hypothetical protein [Lampropedia puyangensis]|uniref:hypothetical protein n=1 Tax=Lampropedia puyangensis TaxID=1330072 RepID=UPI001FCF165F|nr:hypothetical protein [Lampropedia puyangensis]
MKSKFDFSVSRDNLILPFMGDVYEKFAMPVGWLVLRVLLGGGCSLKAGPS